MPEIAVSSILKTIKMNFGSSGDDGRRGEGTHDRSRYSSQSRYYSEAERYRGRSASGRATDTDRYTDRHGRNQSRDTPRESRYRYFESPPRGYGYGRYYYGYGGSLDRYEHARSRFASSQYGDYYGDRYIRGYGDMRYIRQEPPYFDRYVKYRPGPGDIYHHPKDRFIPYPDDFHRRYRYAYDREGPPHPYDRYMYGYDRYGYGFDRYGYPRYGYDRYGYGYDYAYHGYDRYGPRRYAVERCGYSSRFGLDKSHFENRFGLDNFDRYSRDQPSRVRFDGDRQYRREVRRSSMSDIHDDYSRGRSEFEQPNEVFSRDRSLQSRKEGEDSYRTDGESNLNKRFEPYPQERSMSRGERSVSRVSRDERSVSRAESEVDEVHSISKHEGSRRGDDQFGSQILSERMPTPIPPYPDPRPTYPSRLAITWNDDESIDTTRSRELAVRATYDMMRRRYFEEVVDSSEHPAWLDQEGEEAYLPEATVDVLKVDGVDFRPMDNAKEHRTFDYDLVKDNEHPTPVYRRGMTFIMNVGFRDREYDPSRDNLYLNFYFGPNPSVPKRTRIVLPVCQSEDFKRIPYQWDARITHQENNTVDIEVHVPASCPVGMWRCILETSAVENPVSRLEYRCSEDIYVLFNPFNQDDPVYMENDEQRYEYVINNSGKIYTGGYTNVRGRPWIYGQFDDCVLPAACVLLEMSGLSHAERGNPVKVARALASMIKASRTGKRFNAIWENFSSGLIEPRFEEDFRGGNSPHLWTGSVQIIEEFLKGGATPVKYAQCWVMAALMTSLCRTLGLPARPVTAYVSALDTQDTLTVDRYVDRYGDILEYGPSRDQPDSIWAFHTWCDVWMQRADQQSEYSGWQATDPCRTYRDFRDLFSGSCGPCPTEALRRGDVGQRDDVDAFYASLNSYVRYFYEDDESGWGFSPFKQFRYPTCRSILTKSVGQYDEDGDKDFDELTHMYRDGDRTDTEKCEIFNSCRGLSKGIPAFEYKAAAFNWGEFNPNECDEKNFDVQFKLESPEEALIGKPVTIPVVIINSATEARTIQANICSRSCYYTGILAPYLKRSTTQLTVEPGQQETITLTLDPWDYEEKLVDMAFVKVTVTGFVRETKQSFVDELDFRFNKPILASEVEEMRVGEESTAKFSFTNPLEIPLSDCFLTMEVSGSVCPRTVRIDREVRPRETFSCSQTFVPRNAGEHRLVACFASRQLADIVGQLPIVVKE